MYYPSNFHLMHYPSVTSTMDIAHKYLINNKDQNLQQFVVITDCQTQGRGRLERIWISPEGNFYATYVLDISRLLNCHGLYAIATAVAVAQAFKQLAIDVKLKWPNDIFVENKKVGGILIQIEGSYALIGVGLNLKVTPQDTLLKPATSILSACNKTVDPLQFHGVFSMHLAHCFNLLYAQEFHKIIDLWQKYCLHHQQMVSIHHNNLNQDSSQLYTGLYCGLDISGALILEDLQTGVHRLIYVGDAL